MEEKKSYIKVEEKKTFFNDSIKKKYVHQKKKRRKKDKKICIPLTLLFLSTSLLNNIPPTNQNQFNKN